MIKTQLTPVNTILPQNVDDDVKKKWKFAWLGQDNEKIEISLGETIKKVLQPGIAFCDLCPKISITH